MFLARCNPLTAYFFIPVNQKEKEKEIELNLNLDAQTCSEYLETQRLAEAIKGNLTITMPKNQNANIRVFFTCDPLIVATPSETCLQLDSN